MPVRIAPQKQADKIFWHKPILRARMTMTSVRDFGYNARQKHPMSACKESSMLKKQIRLGSLMLATIMLSMTLLTGCGEDKPSESLRGKVDNEMRTLVTRKFEKLKPEDFTILTEEKMPDGSWEVTYESRSAPEMQLPRFRLIFNVTKAGNVTYRAQKENVPGLPPVGAEALKAQQMQAAKEAAGKDGKKK